MRRCFIRFPNPIRARFARRRLWRVSPLHKKNDIFFRKAETPVSVHTTRSAACRVDWAGGRLFEPGSEDKNLESRFSGLDLTQPFEIPQSRQRNLWKNLALEPQKFGNAWHWSRRNLGAEGGFAGGGGSETRRSAAQARSISEPTGAQGRRSLAELRISTER